MQLFTRLPHRFQPLDISLTPSAPALAFIVKGTYALDYSGRPQPLPREEQPDIMGDDPFMDDIGRSLRYPSDLAAFKPGGEVTLTASCHAPGGRPVHALEAGLEMGKIRKRVRITGDRVWVRGPNGEVAVQGPIPFVTMPLRWERAFGGLSSDRNPMGRGIDPWIEPDGRKLYYLPNIESLASPVRSRSDQPAPAGFAPISPYWQPRLQRQGTRDQHWATFRAPLPPHDFDPRSAHAAPDDQCQPDYWRGDETIVLTNMHPYLERFEIALPGQRMCLFIEVKGAGDTLDFLEIPLVLDTVHVDMESQHLFLVWRQRHQPKRQGAPEIEAVYLAEEPLAEAPRSIEAHYHDYLELKGPVEEPRAVKLERDELAAVGEARKKLIEARVDPSLIEQFDKAKGTQAKFDLVLDMVRKKTAELEAMTATLKPK